MGERLAEKAPQDKRKTLAALLLYWYDRHRRDLPWRAGPKEKPDPYRVWLSEMMLQQTTVAVVVPYFNAFVRRWPTLGALARAREEGVLAQWAGLGYYRRAHALFEAAKVVLKDHGGCFPREERALLELPGVGPYTAAAIRAIAFDLPANVVDGNVERVMARVFAVTLSLPQAKKKLKEMAALCLPDSRHGDYAQALMDLGAGVCTPRAPRCPLCPWRGFCAAYAKGTQTQIPRRGPKAKKPEKRAFAFVLFDAGGRIFLEKRTEKGLLAGMTGVPVSPFNGAGVLSFRKALAFAPPARGWKVVPAFVHHTFTHFRLELAVAVSDKPLAGCCRDGRWVARGRLSGQALPSVMKKVLQTAVRFYEEDDETS